MQEYQPELESGSHEYKRTLNLSQNQVAVKIVQLLRRLNQGDGVAIYSIGVEDDGEIHPLTFEDYTKSTANLFEIAKAVNALVIQTNTREVVINEKIFYYGDFEIRRLEGHVSYQDIKICVFGTVDAGKSTTVGCLITGQLDDGAGSARMNVLTHKHELERGQTSYASHRIMGFDEFGNYINATERYRRYNPRQLIKDASKIITLDDLAGHRQYIVNMTAHFCGCQPDYGMLLLNGDSGISPEDTTKDHLSLLDAYSIPFFAVVTNIDRTTKERFDETLKQFQAICRKYDRKIFPVKNEENLSTALQCLSGNKMVPLFKISNVDGRGHDLLKRLLADIMPRPQLDYFHFTESPKKNMFCLPISNIYKITGVGVVLSGVILNGKVRPKDTIFIGPDGNGIFHKLIVKSLEINFEKIREGKLRDHIALSFTGKIPTEITPVKGMVLIGSDVKQIASKEILIKIRVMKNVNVRIGVGSCPTGFVANRKVAFRILEITKERSLYQNEYLCDDDLCLLKCRLNRYVFATVGTPILFHESSMRASGEVVEVI